MRRLVVLAVATAICAVAKGAVSVEPFPASRKSASAASSAAVPAVQQRYTPVPGGFEIRNGASEFMRPLYGWHGDDDIHQPKRSMPSTSDRPKVALKVFDGMRLDKKARGVLSFGDGTEDVTFRYVWGRAEYDLKGKGTVKMVRSASSDGLLVEVTGDLPPTFDGEWALAAKAEKDGRTYYDFVRKALPRPAGPDTAAAFVTATDRVERVKGNPIMFGETAHANVHAITLDPSKELKSLRLVCCGKETIVGILAVTLYREAVSAFGGIPVNPKLPMSFGVDSAAFARAARGLRTRDASRTRRSTPS